MPLPPYTSASIAQALEFSGYGPVVPEGERGLWARVKGLDFHLTLKDGGGLEGFEFDVPYQNTLHPTVHTVFSAIANVFMPWGELPWFETQIEEDFGYPNRPYFARSTYLWLSSHPGQTAQPQRLVLNELLIHRRPVWHQLRTTAYEVEVYEAYWAHLTDLLQEFKTHGQLPPRATAKGLESCLRFCTAPE